MSGEFRAVATARAVVAVHRAHVQTILSTARHEEATRAISRHTAGIVPRDVRGPGHRVQLPGWQPNAAPVRPGPGAGPPGPFPAPGRVNVRAHQITHAVLPASRPSPLPSRKASR